MTDDGTDRSDDRTEGNGIGAALRDLLDAVADLRTGGSLDVSRDAGDRGRTDYGFSVSTLDAAARRESGEADRGVDSAGPREGGEHLETAEEEYATAVHSAEGGVVVTADLPGVDPESLSAGVASETLLIAEGERVLTRVSLPRGDLDIADATFNNGVLELRLRPTENTAQ